MTTVRKEEIPIKENGEKLIPLSRLSPKVTVEPQYYLQKIPGSIPECYLREGAAERLLKAAEKLSERFHFHIFDAWRPFEVQQALYLNFKKKLEKQGLADHRLKETLNKYVNKPSKNPKTPSNHLTGGAIDLTLATEEGPIPMGTDFDDFSEASRMDAYERKANPTQEEIQFHGNRVILREVMEAAGFTNYEEEWWHFDYGNQNWALRTGNTAFYGGIHKLDADK